MTTSAPRVIGMLGGMSWESSAQYYRLTNEPVRERLGGLHSARIVLASLDFADVEALQATGRGKKQATCSPRRPRDWRPPAQTCF